jgi:hypothetical protein
VRAGDDQIAATRKKSRKDVSVISNERGYQATREKTISK